MQGRQSTDLAISVPSFEAGLCFVPCAGLNITVFPSQPSLSVSPCFLNGVSNCDLHQCGCACVAAFLEAHNLLQLQFQGLTSLLASVGTVHSWCTHTHMQAKPSHTVPGSNSLKILAVREPASRHKGTHKDRREMGPATRGQKSAMSGCSNPEGPEKFRKYYI